jgi:HD-like signal output (HDOD) protein
MSKRILFLATDPTGSESIRTDLATIEAGWETAVVGTFDEAVAAIEAHPVDAIVADHHVTDASGAKLLNWAAEHRPKSARLIMAEAVEREQVLRLVLAPHHFLPKPIAPDVLRGTIQSALLLDRAMPNEVLLTLASRIRVFPPLPSLYFRVLNELKSPDFSAQTVGEIVARDLAMTTRLLQVINSGFYSLPRRITDLTEAVNLLGQESVKSLIIGIHLFLQHEHIKPLYFSISQLWRHSTAVAQGARLITQMETGDPGRADEAYTAGLLHDIGKLVLANNFEAQYNQVQKTARASHKPLWEAETEEFGVSHAELGAFILGRWGMPVALLEATALHHQPGRLGSPEFSPLTAVHIANAIEHELHGTQEGDISSTLDQPYIESLRLEGLIDGWKECIRNGKASPVRKPEPRRAGEVVVVASPSDISPSPAHPRLSGPTGAASPRNKWVSAVAATAAATTVMASLGWYLGQHWPGQDPMPAQAKTRPGADASTEDASGDTHPVAPLAPTADTNAAPSNRAEPTKPDEKAPEL